MSDILNALVHSEQLSHAATAVAEKKCDFPVVALPGDMQIHDLEKYQICRNQFRGEMKTNMVNDFLAYTNQQPAGTCFVHSDSLCATTYFDMGTPEAPGHCKHKARLQLITTAAYEAVLRINDLRQSQQNLAEFMEDWRDLIKPLDSDLKIMDMKEAIHAVRNVKIDEKSSAEHNTESFSKKRSAMEELNAAGKDDKPLPGYLEFTCNPYFGLLQHTLMVRIYMSISRAKEPEFSVHIIKLDEAVEEMNRELFKMIEDGLDDKIQLYAGSFISD